MLIGNLKRRVKRFARKLLLPADTPPRSRRPKRWPVYSIGIYVGKSPVHLAPPETIKNPVLTHEDILDIPAMFVADPFMLKMGHTWYMFFEALNRQTKKGEIGFATSEDGLKWTYQHIVLKEAFHLSYPYVFEWMNDYYMIPESGEAGFIRLYKALQFPAEWVCIKTLLSKPTNEVYFVDPTVLHHDNRWWLFTQTNLRSMPAALRLYYADTLLGPWREHRQSPIVKENNHIARPAGRMLSFNGQILRFSQDCYPVYGSHVRGSRITELTIREYREQEIDENPVLTGSGTGWNGCGMHHIDAHQTEHGEWIACVDGWFWTSIENCDLQARV